MTLKEFEVLFPDDESIIKYYIQIRYNGVLTCSHCGTSGRISPIRNKPKKFQCNYCNNTFSIFKDTIFEKSSTPLSIWFYVIRLFLNSKTGDSAKNIQREVGVTLKCAWRMLKQIRIAMEEPDLLNSFSGIIEIDETYHGGRPRLIPNNDLNPNYKRNKRGRGTSKHTIVGIKERGTGRYIAFHAEADENGNKITSRQILDLIDKARAKGVIIYVFTDDYRIYNFLKNYKLNFVHKTVNHTKHQYTNGKTENGDLIHTNGIENLWSNLKCTFWGTYRKRMIPKYLQSYINEVTFRQNNCKELINPETDRIIYKNRYMNAVNKLLKNSVLIKKDNYDENNEDKEVDGNEYEYVF